MKQILVTGSRGFLGRFLVTELEKRGHRIIPIHSGNCDLTNADNLHQFDSQKFDEIFHLAAWTQAGDFCLYHPGEQWLINQKLNTNLLDYWRRQQPQAKLIFMGTSCVYDPELPLQEPYYLTGKPIDSLFTYAMTKKMLLVGAMALQKQFGLNYLCLVPSTLYGGHYYLEGKQMHFIFDLVRKIIRGKYLGEKVILWGNGLQKRELIHVVDFVNIMLELNEKCRNQLINIGGGKEYEIREFAEMICHTVGYDFSKIEFDTSKYVGAKSKCLDIALMQSLLPYYKRKDMKSGIQEIVDYFLENKNVILS